MQASRRVGAMRLLGAGCACLVECHADYALVTPCFAHLQQARRRTPAGRVHWDRP